MKAKRTTRYSATASTRCLLAMAVVCLFAGVLHAVQTATPTDDVTVGVWTNTPLHSKLAASNEVTAEVGVRQVGSTGVAEDKNSATFSIDNFSVSGDNTLILLLGNSSADKYMTSATRDGQGFTEMPGSYQANGGPVACMWYRVGPNSGSANLSGTWNDKAENRLTAYCYAGVDQADPFGDDTGGIGTTDGGVTVSSCAAGNLLHDIMMYEGNNTLNRTGRLWVDDPVGSGKYAASSREYVTSDGNKQMSWNGEDGKKYGQVAVEIRAAAVSNEVLFGSVSAPSDKTGHKVRYTMWYSGTGSAEAEGYLYDGSTLISTGATNSLTTSATVYEWTLTAVEAGNITESAGSYTNLRLRVRCRTTSQVPTVHYSWAQFECPSAGAPPTVTDPTNSAQAIDGTGYITIGTDVDDNEDSDCKLRVEYSVDGKTTWTNAHIAAASVGVDYGATPNINNGAANHQIGDATPIKATNGANTVAFTWDTKNAGNGEATITTGYIAAVWVRVKANDGADSTWATNTSSFAIDNAVPVVSTAVTLVDTTPTSGDTSFQLDAAFTENNPDTNMFGYKLNGAGAYTEEAGDANVADPSAKTFNVALDGNDYFNGIRCVHTDDFGNATPDEDTTVVYVCPTSPPAPTVDNPSEDTLDVSISTNLTPGLLYAIQCTNGTNFVQSDGTLGAGIYWDDMSGWGATVTVTNLSVSTTYGFRVAAGNPNDATPTTAENSASGYGASASDTTTETPAPEIGVFGNNNAIVDGSTSPASSNYTDFGSVPTNSSREYSFVVTNTGNANLNITNVTITGTHQADFSVTTNASSPVAAAGSTVFSIEFTPSGLGVHTATVEIANSDSDEHPYDFRIVGTGTLLAGAPALDSDYVGATNIGLTSAWLTGYLTDTGSTPTYVWIYYGDVDAGTTKANWDSTNYVGQMAEGAFSTNIATGIDSNTAYYYQIYVSNDVAGVWLANSMPFKTGPWLLPFTDDFETAPPTRLKGELRGQNGWESTEVGAATIQTGTTYNGSVTAMKIEGTGATVTVSHPIDDPAATNIVWLEMYTLAPRSSGHTPPADIAGAWYVSTNGKIVVFNGAAEEELGSGPTVPTNTWVRFTVRADYNAKKWALYYNGVEVSTGKTFYNTGNSSCTEVLVSGGTNGAVYVDDVYVGLTSPGLPPVVSNAAPTVGSATNATLAGTLSFTGGVETTVYTYWGDNDGVTNKGGWDYVITNGVLGEGSFSAGVDGLYYGLRYYYRCYATNSAGDDWADATTNFITDVTTWSLTNTIATNIGTSTATLLGSLDATQAVFDVVVYWSQSNNADSTAWLSDGSAQSTSVGWFTNASGESLSEAVASLSLSTNYYYTFMMTNVATNVWAAGTNGYFVTLDEPVFPPFYETFEDNPSYMANTLGSMHNQHYWQASPTTGAQVQAAEARRGSKAGTVDEAILVQAFTNEAITNVWIDFYAKPPFSGGPPTFSPTNSAGFYVDSAGRIVVRNGFGWETKASTVVSNAWSRFTFYMDYSARKWKLYACDSTTNKLSTLVASDLDFQATAPHTFLTKFLATNAASESMKTYIDDITIATNMPLCISDDGDLLPDAWELAYTNALGGMNNSTDSDGDGYTDLTEWIAGTNPKDSTSFLKIQAADLATEAANDVLFNVMAGEGTADSGFMGDTMGRVAVVVAASGTPNGTYTSIGSGTDSGSGSIAVTDASAVTEADSKFYRVSVSLAGSSVTNTEEWAMYKQDRAVNTKYLVAVPVNYSGTNDNLAGTLGAQLLRGAQVGADTSDTNKTVLSRLNTNGVWEEFYLVDNAGTPVWWDGAQIATNVVDASMAFTLTTTSGGTRDRNNCVFIGRSYTGVTDVAITTNNPVQQGNAWFAWTLIPWTRSLPGSHDGSTTDMLGFVGSGARGGVTALPRRGRTLTPADDLGDQVWVWQNNTIWDYYWLMDGMWDASMDDKWWNNRTGDYADIDFMPGRAYWYKHWVGTNGTNFVWSPK